MGYFILLSTIICSSLLTIMFKYFDKYKVKTANAIVVNYFVASAFAFYFSNDTPSITKLLSFPWWWAAIGLAFLFITLFNLLAITSQKIGVTQSNIANKTTFIFPTIMGIWFFNEHVDWIKILGVLTALVAVYITAKEKSERAVEKHSNFALIIVLFLGGGLLDLLLSYSQNQLIQNTELSLFSGYSFGIAGVFGLIHLLVEALRKQNHPIKRKDFTGGIILGSINYFSIFCFLKSLTFDYLESSVVFTVVNMGVIVTASLLSAVLFKESLSSRKIVSIILAVLAILLVTFSDKILN